MSYRHMFRRLLETPTFTLFCILTLAVSIGAMTATVAAVRVATGPPPGIADVGRVVSVRHFVHGSGPIVSLSWGDYQDLRARQRSFAGIAGWAIVDAPLVADGVPSTGVGEIVDDGYFDVVGSAPRVGRLLQREDHRTRARVVVISHHIWSNQFESGDVIGRTVRIRGVPFEIVGVSNEAFHGLWNGGLMKTAFWIPMSTASVLPAGTSNARFGTDDRSARWVSATARLAPDISVERAFTDVRAVGAALDREMPLGSEGGRAPYSTGRLWHVERLDSRAFGVPAGMVTGLTLSLYGAVALVLLVAFTNVSNLMLARWSRRGAEVRIRAALGASRWMLVREATAEAAILCAAGALGSIVIARALIHVLSGEVPVTRGLSLQILAAIDLPALLVALGATGVGLLIGGIVPALVATRLDLRSALTEDSSTATPRWRGRRYLIALQVTVSVVLVSVASLFVAHAARQQQLPFGIDADRLAFAHVVFNAQGFAPLAASDIALEIMRRVERNAGVSSASVISGLPFGTLRQRQAMLRDESVAGNRTLARILSATSGFERTLGLTISTGRFFDLRDTASAPRVVVLDQTASLSLFGESAALGRTITMERRQFVGEPKPEVVSLTVIGVVAGNSRSGRADQGVIFLPFEQHYEPGLVFLARTDGDAGDLLPHLRQAVASVEPMLAASQVDTVALAREDKTFHRIVAAITGGLGLVALVLAAGGLYGVLAQLVSARTREIGIRVTLGAAPGRILRLIVREGLSPIVLGLVLGLGLAAIARLASRIFIRDTVSAIDPVQAVLVSGFFIATGIAACYLPARHASRVDPNVALRGL